MKTLLKSTISLVLIVQVLLMPVLPICAIAAPPFDALGSPTALPPSHRSEGSATAPVTGSSAYAYQTGNYFTDSSGNILMNVNVWGNVMHPGQVAIPAGADISTLISLAGGPSEDANVKKIRVNRSRPDENGAMSYLVNLDSYVKAGDRTPLLVLQPNDTVIIPKDKSIDLTIILSVVTAAISIIAIAK